MKEAVSIRSEFREEMEHTIKIVRRFLPLEIVEHPQYSQDYIEGWNDCLECMSENLKS